LELGRPSPSSGDGEREDMPGGVMARELVWGEVAVAGAETGTEGAVGMADTAGAGGTLEAVDGEGAKEPDGTVTGARGAWF
jgi:hypothetical protein